MLDTVLGTIVEINIYFCISIATFSHTCQNCLEVIDGLAVERHTTKRMQWGSKEECLDLRWLREDSIGCYPWSHQVVFWRLPILPSKAKILVWNTKSKLPGPWLPLRLYLPTVSPESVPPLQLPWPPFCSVFRTETEIQFISVDFCLRTFAPAVPLPGTHLDNAFSDFFEKSAQMSSYPRVLPWPLSKTATLTPIHLHLILQFFTIYIPPWCMCVHLFDWLLSASPFRIKPLWKRPSFISSETPAPRTVPFKCLITFHNNILNLQSRII